jgi:endoglucanase
LFAEKEGRRSGGASKLLRDLLFDLVHIHAPSGFETRLAAKLSSELKTYSNEVEIDLRGNVVARIDGSSKTLWITAHMDEISAVVTRVDDHVWFEPVGWFEKEAMLGASVTILAEDCDVQGVGRSVSAHLKDVTLTRDVWIDVGEYQDRVRVGDPIVFSANAQWLGKNILSSKAIDDRAGVSVLVEAARSIPHIQERPTIYLTGTVQEEVGAIGVGEVLEKIEPQYHVNVDTTYAEDPSLPSWATAPLGNVVFRRFEKSEKYATILFPDRKMISELIKTSEELGIPYTLDAAKTFTDSARIYCLTPRVKTCQVLIPRRYSHSQREVVDVRSVERAAQLITRMIERHKEWME